MFIKLHYREVTALLKLIEDIEDQSFDSEEQHAIDTLRVMKQQMELRYKKQEENHNA